MDNSMGNILYTTEVPRDTGYKIELVSYIDDTWKLERAYIQLSEFHDDLDRLVTSSDVDTWEV
jgi:hypothetical protein